MLLLRKSKSKLNFRELSELSGRVEIFRVV
jgi:hypothetical protein